MEEEDEKEEEYKLTDSTVFFLQACQEGDLELVEFFSKEPDVDLYYNNSEQPLLDACNHDHREIVAWFIKNRHVTRHTVSHPDFQKCLNAHFEYFKPFMEKTVMNEGLQECPICMDKAVDVKTNCNHFFCIECMNNLMDKSELDRICPLCRTDITEFHRLIQK